MRGSDDDSGSNATTIVTSGAITVTTAGTINVEANVGEFGTTYKYVYARVVTSAATIEATVLTLRYIPKKAPVTHTQTVA